MVANSPQEIYIKFLASTQRRSCTHNEHIQNNKDLK